MYSHRWLESCAVHKPTNYATKTIFLSLNYCNRSVNSQMMVNQLIYWWKKTSFMTFVFKQNSLINFYFSLDIRCSLYSWCNWNINIGQRYTPEFLWCKLATATNNGRTQNAHRHSHCSPIYKIETNSNWRYILNSSNLYILLRSVCNSTKLLFLLIQKKRSLTFQSRSHGSNNGAKYFYQFNRSLTTNLRDIFSVVSLSYQRVIRIR